MQQTIQQKRKRQIIAFTGFLLAFAAMIWFGYSNFVKPTAKLVTTASGLNNKLPDAGQPKEMNKLELYMQAEKDSIAKKEQRANDSSYSNSNKRQETGKPEFKASELMIAQRTTERKNSNHDPIKREAKQNELKINSGIAQTDFKIQYPTNEKPNNKIEQENITPPLGGRGVEARGVDPDLKQLEGMLDKLIEIQHPEIVKQRNKRSDKNSDTVSKLNLVRSSNANQTIQAVVHNTQIISSGATVKLRLVQDIMIGSATIPKGSFLYGICSISNERLTVQLTNIPFNNQVIPVSLSVFDMDGIEGIYIPGAIEREVSKEGADQAIQSFNLNGLNSSIAGQAASAGMQATKALLSKKVKLIRVTVKAGHHVLLQNKMGY